MSQPKQSSLYTKEFMELLKKEPYYVNTNSDEWKWEWEFPLPNNFPYIVEEVEGVGIIYMQKSPLDEKAPKNEEAPTSIPTDPHKWMTDKEIHEEIFLGSRYCSYCDYTPCRCKKEKEDK